MPLGKREALRVEAGDTNTFKMEFDFWRDYVAKQQ